MADTARRSSPWLAFLAGAGLVVLVLAAWLLLARGRPEADRPGLSLPLPSAPVAPDAPKMPAPAIPTPK